MISFLVANLSTIVIAAILVIAVGLIIRKMIRDKKAGKTCGSCGGSCSCCQGNCKS